MDAQAIRDLQRRLEALERTAVRYRQGTVDDIGPLDVTLGSSDVIIEDVPALTSALPFAADDVLAALTFGGGILALGSLGDPPAWTAYTPTVTSMTAGTGGTNTGRWVKHGRTVHAAGKVTLGTGGSLSGADITISLPFAPGAGAYAGAALAHESGANSYLGVTLADSGGGASLYTRLGNGSGGVVALGATAPFTWADGDWMQWQITYEAGS